MRCWRNEVKRRKGGRVGARRMTVVRGDKKGEVEIGDLAWAFLCVCLSGF